MFNELVNGIGDQFRFKQVKTTGVAFKLITKISVNILICAALLISLRQFFGFVAFFVVFVFLIIFRLSSDPIECATDSYTYKKAIETSCWLDGLFINKALVYNSKIGKDITRWHFGSGIVMDWFLTFCCLFSIDTELDQDKGNSENPHTYNKTTTNGLFRCSCYSRCFCIFHASYGTFGKTAWWRNLLQQAMTYSFLIMLQGILDAFLEFLLLTEFLSGATSKLRA